MSFQAFPSIEQFRNVIRNVKSNAQYAGRDENDDPIYDPSLPIPTLEFRGTVKLHGTNAGIVREGDGPIEFQSRSRTLSYTSDNAGFYLWGQKHLERIADIIRLVEAHVSGPGGAKSIAIFGEWCGGNIQKGVAINGLPQMFVVFQVKIDEEWVDPMDIHFYFDHPECNIHSILHFPIFYQTIDFNHPELATNKMVDLTLEVEKECPVALFFGNKGIGEGIVWQCISDGWLSSKYWFKTKGEKHSSSKVKTLAEVDVTAVQAIKDFVDYAVTEARLEQGLQWIVSEEQKPFEMQSMGDFLRWIFNDVIKEESDVIAANQLDAKKLGSAIANKARPWYISRYNQAGSV